VLVVDVTIKLANRDTISPLGIVRDVEVLCGKIKYTTNFLVLGSPQDDFCPIIFGRPFLNTVKDEIDCVKKKRFESLLVIYLMSLIFPSLVDNLMIKNCLVRIKLLVLLLLLCLLLIR
jgi:hypothetical protein